MFAISVTPPRPRLLASSPPFPILTIRIARTRARSFSDPIVLRFLLAQTHSHVDSFTLRPTYFQMCSQCPQYEAFVPRLINTRFWSFVRCLRILPPSFPPHPSYLQCIQPHADSLIFKKRAPNQRERFHRKLTPRKTDPFGTKWVGFP